ncbi:MAG: ferritin-like domain-containing protein [Solirubrobacteraceae bacterium]
MASRRQLLCCATVAGGAILLAGCGGRSSRPSVSGLSPPARDTDVALLNRVLDLEHATIAAYTAGIPRLSGAGQIAAKRFLAQELSHAGQLRRLIKQARGYAHVPEPSYDLGNPHDGRDVLMLLHRSEGAQVATYIEVLPGLSPGSVRAAVASILANDAQHISILRSAIGLEPDPAALVTGSE